LNWHKFCPGDLKWIFGDMVGLRRIMHLKCDVCGLSKSGGTSRPNNTLNTSIVASNTLACGGSIEMARELFGFTGIQLMARATFFRFEQELHARLEQLLEKVLKENIAEEYWLAEPQPGEDIRKIRVASDLQVQVSQSG
jgi:hypothetical protein